MSIPTDIREILFPPKKNQFLIARPPRSGGRKAARLRGVPAAAKNTGSLEAFADQETFNCMLRRERKRTERTGDPFVLALIGLVDLHDGANHHAIEEACGAVQAGIRDTDFAGWYENQSVIGVIYTSLRDTDRALICEALQDKIHRILGTVFDAGELGHVVVSFHFFPEDEGRKKPAIDADEKLYPDITHERRGKRLHAILKRGIDLAGSLFALVLFSPVFIIAPILIKLTSKGPVLFKQRRLGHLGKEFAFLKFRTMHVNNDSAIHQEYVRSLIEQGSRKNGNGVFKITNDPRVTPIGRFLRRTSLDELPQFLNVLKGDMSIVGPRPPIPYEVAEYRFWHRRRVVEVKPGITGLWQVEGRSRTTFDDMVRLDLQYIKCQSLLLDFKIILKTPRAVLSGSGAY